MHILIKLGFILELVVLFPSFIVVLLIFFFSKNQSKGGKLVDRFMHRRKHWLFSLLIWIAAYFLFV